MKKLVPFMLVAMIFVIAGAASAQGSWADKVKVNGYAQIRFDGGDDPAVDDFTLRRAFTNVIGTPNDDTMIVLSLATFDPMPDRQDDIMVYNLFVDYKIDDTWSVRFGQVPTYFGLEAWQSSSQRMALERARILQGTGGGPNLANEAGFYFFGATDRGLWVKYDGQNGAPDAYFGVCNGQGRSADTAAADGKNVSIDLKWDRDWGMFGASWFDGEWDDGAGNVSDRSAWAAYVRWVGKSVAFQGEYADGEMMGRDRDGWYAQLELVNDANYTPFIKYEEFNSDDGAVGGSSSDFDALHGGVALQVDPNNELTLQISDIDASTTVGSSVSSMDNFEYGLSWQTSY